MTKRAAGRPWSPSAHPDAVQPRLLPDTREGRVRRPVAGSGSRLRVLSERLLGVSDNSLLVACLTGVTAIAASSLASWLTSRGNARAARVQVDATTDAQRREGLRQTRRAAYLDLIERAHAVADGLRGVDALSSAECEAALAAHRERHQQLRRAVTLIGLEGPSSVEVAASNLLIMSGTLSTALAATAENVSRDNRREFQETLRAYIRLIRPIVDAAAAALNEA